MPPTLHTLNLTSTGNLYIWDDGAMNPLEYDHELPYGSNFQSTDALMKAGYRDIRYENEWQSAPNGVDGYVRTVSAVK